MIVKFRIKDNKVIVGYITNDNYFIPLDMIKNYTPDNVVLTKQGYWVAKSGSSIKTIDIRDVEIDINRRASVLVGKPKIIYNSSFGRLSKTQKFVVDQLNTSNPAVINKKRYSIKITMKDLSALTAFTGVEYSLFERNDQYIVFRGSDRGMHISQKDTSKLISGKYSWVGHTHPGNTYWCLMPSDSDYNTLKLLNQQRSMIYNSVGDYYIFERED